MTIDLRGKRPGDEDVHVEDYLYEVGSGSDVPGLDDQLRGAVTGDILEFTTASSDCRRVRSRSRR